MSTEPDSIKHPPKPYVCQLTEQEIEDNAQRLLREFRQGNDSKSKTTFVSCWYESQHESDAMWRLYSEQSGYAVAIQTSVGLLKKHTDEQIAIGRIKYIDYCTEFPHIGFPHFYKRRSFEHEREVRAVIIDRSADESLAGKHVDVNLRSLIRTVKVSPLAPPWFLEVVQDVTRKYDLNVDVSISTLTKRAFR
jgi:hypothetical protein